MCDITIVVHCSSRHCVPGFFGAKITITRRQRPAGTRALRIDVLEEPGEVRHGATRELVRGLGANGSHDIA